MTSSEGCNGSLVLAVRDVRRRDRDGQPWDALLGITGELAITGDEGSLVTLPNLPVVELARELDRWLIGLPPEGADFVYTSALARDEPGLVYVHRAEPCWRIGSIWATEDQEIATTLRTVAAAANDYVAEVARLVRPLALDLPRLLRERAR